MMMICFVLYSFTFYFDKINKDKMIVVSIGMKSILQRENANGKFYFLSKKGVMLLVVHVRGNG